MIKPTTKPAIIIGPATFKMIMSASAPICTTATSFMAAPLNRHSNNFPVGFEDLVTHGNDRLQGKFGLGDRGHHVTEVALANDGGKRLALALLADFDGPFDGVLDQLANSSRGRVAWLSRPCTSPFAAREYAAATEAMPCAGFAVYIFSSRTLTIRGIGNRPAPP
jgi:hypothetical protein